VAKPIDWETSLTKAKGKAKKKERMILMDFYNNLCIGCQQLAATTYLDSNVCFYVENHFIPLQVDFNKNKALVKRFGVKWTPTTVILDADGDEHYRFVGFLRPEDFAGQIMLGRGKAEFNLDHLEEAVQCFQEILVRYPKTDAAPEAQYLLGVSKYKASHDPKELKLGFEVLQKDYPQSEWTKKAQVYALIPSTP
jgi:thiol-disulfide isomerase/thioredoxin